MQAKLDLERQHIFLKYNYNQLFPNLDVVGSGGGRGADPSFSHAAGDMNPFYTIGVILSFPFGNRTAHNNYEATKAAEKQAILKMKKLEQDVLVEVDTASTIMESDYKRVAATRKAREAAQKALDVQQTKLREGTVPSYMVMEAQRQLTTARSSEIRALAAYNKARAQLAFAEGMVLERNNIRLDIR